MRNQKKGKTQTTSAAHLELVFCMNECCNRWSNNSEIQSGRFERLKRMKGAYLSISVRNILFKALQSYFEIMGYDTRSNLNKNVVFQYNETQIVFIVSKLTF
jgi:hypothetical protein